MILEVLGSNMAWLSTLQLTFEDTGQETVLTERIHNGALRVQRALYPEPELQSTICHVIVLYPPAGIALGDQLNIRVRLQAGSQAVLTTPGANKWYGQAQDYVSPLPSSSVLPSVPDYSTSATSATPFESHIASQNVTATLGASARLEWLPQENCFYQGTHAVSHNHFILDQTASLIAWEINLLGRQFADEQFSEGKLCLRNTFWRQSEHSLQLILAESIEKEATDRWFSQALGLAHHVVFATLWAIPDQNALKHLDEWVLKLRTVIEQHQYPLTATATTQGVMIRYLGNDVRSCFTAFTAMRGHLRYVMWQQNDYIPRIWAT